MEGNVKNLARGTHPMHVHEYGCLSDGFCMKTGAHYNPRNAVFAEGNAKGYIGNLDAIVAEKDKEASFNQLFANLPLRGS